jgi:hypothetical protein
MRVKLFFKLLKIVEGGFGQTNGKKVSGVSGVVEKMLNIDGVVYTEGSESSDMKNTG